MQRHRPVRPIDPARIRRIQGSFSWIDHRFIPMMDGLTRNENLLYLWLVAVGDRMGLSFYSDEKTASKIKITVGEILKAREGLVEKGLIAWRNGLSQVLSLPSENDEFQGGNYAARREPHATNKVPERCREPVLPADIEAARDMSKRFIKDILRQLEGGQDAKRVSARRVP